MTSLTKGTMFAIHILDRKAVENSHQVCHPYSNSLKSVLINVLAKYQNCQTCKRRLQWFCPICETVYTATYRARHNRDVHHLGSPKASPMDTGSPIEYNISSPPEPVNIHNNIMKIENLLCSAPSIPSSSSFSFNYCTSNFQCNSMFQFVS